MMSGELPSPEQMAKMADALKKAKDKFAKQERSVIRSRRPGQGQQGQQGIGEGSGRNRGGGEIVGRDVACC